MKKSIIPAMLLSLVTLSGLVGCGGKKPSSPTTPTPVGETTVNQLISTYFNDGKIGDYNKETDKYPFDLKSEYQGDKNPEVTITGTYVSGGEWKYYGENRSGYIRDSEGEILFLHSGAENVNIKADIKIGAKIKVTGKLTAYHGYPQINTGWTYELVEEAPANSTYETILSYYAETEPSALYNADRKTMNLDKAKTLVALKNMVLIGSVDSSNLTYFTPLSELGKADALRIGVYRFYHASPTVYAPGNVFNIYGAVTSYEGSIQLHATASSSNDKFTGIQTVAANDLTAEQKFILADLQSSLDSIKEKVSLDYTSGEDNVTDESITVKKSLSIDGMKVFYKVSLPSDKGDATEAWATIEEDDLNRSLVIKKQARPDETTKSLTGKIELVRRVCAASDCADATAAFALTDATKYKEEKKTITVVHMYEKLTSLNATINNGIPEGLSYITNNTSYPDPKFDGPNDYAGALKLAFKNGGFETSGSYDFTNKATLKINLAIVKYDKDTSNPAADSDRHTVLTVTAYDASGNSVYTFDSKELYDATNQAFRDQTFEITASANITSIKVIAKTLDKATVYVKSVEVTPTTASSTTPETNPDTPKA